MDSAAHWNRAAKYRLSARECLSEAIATSDEIARPSLLSMAQQWASLARQAERNADLVSVLCEKLGATREK